MSSPVGDPLAPLAALVAALANLVAQLVGGRRVRPGVVLVTGLITGVGLRPALQVLPPRWVVSWITVGGRRSGWFGYAPPAGRRQAPDSGADAGPPLPLPALRDLVGVVPIGQGRRAGTATLTLLSLERYGDGFLVRGGLLWNEEPEGSATSRAIEWVDVLAADNRSTAYRGRSYGGGGLVAEDHHRPAVEAAYRGRSYGGGGGGASWRFDHAFALDPNPANRRRRRRCPRSCCSCSRRSASSRSPSPPRSCAIRTIW